MDSDFSISALVCPELKTTHRLNFTGPNFRIWRRKIDFVLVDNKVKYVLTVPKPPLDDAALHQKWLDDDFTARHIILGALHDNLQMCYVDRHETAKSLMDAVTALFTKPSMSRRMVKLRKYSNHKMSEGKSVNEHILEMGSMVYELESEGVKVPEELQAVMLMNSLPGSWEDSITAAIVNMDIGGGGEEEMGLEKVSERLKGIGAWKEVFAKRDEAERMSTSSKGQSSGRRFNGKCYSCGRFGHRQADCDLEEVVRRKNFVFDDEA